MIDELIKIINAYSNGTIAQIDSFPVFNLLTVVVNVTAQLAIILILVNKLIKGNLMTKSKNAGWLSKRFNPGPWIALSIFVSLTASALFVNSYRINFLESSESFIRVYFNLLFENIGNVVIFKGRYDSIIIYTYVIFVPIYIYMNIRIKKKINAITIGDTKLTDDILAEGKIINDFLTNSLNDKFVKNKGTIFVDNLIEGALAKHLLVNLDVLHPDTFDFSMDNKTFTQGFVNSYFVSHNVIKKTILNNDYQVGRNFTIESSDCHFYNNTQCDALGNQEGLLDNFSGVKLDESILSYLGSLGVEHIPFYGIKKGTTQWQEKKCNSDGCTIVNHVVHHQKKMSSPFKVPIFSSTQVYLNMGVGIRNLFTPHNCEVTLPTTPDINSPLGMVLFTKWMSKDDLEVLTNKGNDLYKLHEKYHYEANRNEFAERFKGLYNLIDYIKSGVEVNADIESIIVKHNNAILETLKEKVGGKYA